jgi:penicillin-binding protein 1A
VFFALGLLAVAGIAGVGYVLANVALPPAQIPTETTFIYDANGDRLAELSADENRVSKDLSEVSPHLINAVISAEDREFRNHNGVNLAAIARATVADLRGQPLQGGSTITQQYVKVVYTNRERTIMRKLREATLAIKLERQLAKDQILERYLNIVYFGRGAYGAQAAAQAYFGVDVDELDQAQAAYLAGLLRAPEFADANRADAPEQAQEANRRRNIVIRAMAEEGHLTEDEVRFIAGVDVADYVRPRDEVVRDRIAHAQVGTQFFVEHVRAEMEARYGASRLTGGGLHIHTTLDPELQRQAYEAVYGTLDAEGDPAGAVVSVDADGHVKAMVGGKDFSQSSVNLALGRAGGGSGRQPGSTFKPFVLAELIRQGYSVDSVMNSPGTMEFEEFATNGEPWKVSNYEGSSHGAVTVAEATRRSSNTVYAQLAVELGIDRIAGTARDLGIRSDIPAGGGAIVLGAGEVSVLEMANAYRTFAARGERVDPLVVTRVTDSDGELIEEFAPKRERVLEENQADIINDVLRGVVTSGTGTRAAIGSPVAGKTGTTQNNVDAWFVGYTPGLSTAVWMGHPEGQIGMENVHGVARVSGGTLPAEIFSRYMTGAVGSNPERYGGDFVAPASREGKLLGGRVAVPVTTAAPQRRSDDDERSTTTTEAPPEDEPPPTTEAEPPPTSEPPPTTEPTQPPQEPAPTTTTQPPTEAPQRPGGQGPPGERVDAQAIIGDLLSRGD